MDHALIGRENEVRAVQRALEAGRLVTVVGPTGVGKSLIARMAARWSSTKLPRDHVDLDGARTAADIAQRLCQARCEATVADATEETVAFLLARRPCLVVFDNADDARRPLADILARWSTLSVGSACVVTTCVRLGLAFETVVRVAPFPSPTPSDDSAALEEYDAVQLFGAELQRRSATTQVPLEAVGRIVRRLEGLPLSLVRAAGIASVVGIAAVERLLDADGIESIASDERDVRPRHRTLGAAFDAQWAAIDDDDELRAFASSVAAFEGPLTLAGAAAIAGCPTSAAIERLTQLTERSLLLPEGDATTVSFRFLGGVRARARACLVGAERDRTLSRFIEYFSQDDDASRAGGLAMATMLSPIEHPSARLAFAHALQLGQHDQAARIAIGMAPVFLSRGPLDEYVAVLETVKHHADALSPDRAGAIALLTGLALLFSGHREASFDPFADAARLGNASDRAMALSYLGLVSGLGGDFARAREFLAHARTAAGETLAPLIEARVLKNVANVLAEEGDGTALEVITRASECFRRGGDLRGEGFMVLMRASFLLDKNRLEQASVDARQALVLLGRAGDSRSAGWADCILATIDREGGRLELAREGYRRSINTLRVIGDQQTLGIVLQLWAALELELREPTVAVDLCTEACMLLEAAGDHEHLAIACALLGAAYAMDGHHEAARASFERARETIPPRGREARRVALSILALSIADRRQQEQRLANAHSAAEGEEVRSALRILERFVRHGSVRPRPLVLHVATDARWLITPGQGLVDLARKPVLRRLLDLLVRRRERAPGAPVTTAQLLRQGWPNQRARPDAALNRLYVALARLRDLGLEPALEKTTHGYFIRPDVSIERSKEPDPRLLPS